MPHAYAYIRWSRAAQQAGDSESRQLAELARFEVDTGIQIVKKYRDDGRSAFRGDNSRRGEFRVLLDDIKEGKIKPGDYLVVESIDRITRQRVLDGVQMLQEILKSGVILYTTTDHKTYSVLDPKEDLQTLLMISVIAQRAHEESDMKSKRLLSSWEKRRRDAEQGKIIIKKGGSVPYGLRVVDSKFVVQEDEQKEIQTIFEMLLTTGINTVIKKINKISKKTWNNGTLLKIISNRTVIGYMPTHRVIHTNDGKSIKTSTGHIQGYYPNIIEPSLFYRAISSMQERKAKGYAGRRDEQDFNIFKHLIFCSKCGGKLYYDHRGSRYKDKIYPYFKCNNVRINPEVCNASNMRFEHVLGLFLAAIKNAEKVATDLSEFKNISEAPKNFLEALEPLKANPNSDDRAHAKKLEELADYESKLDNLSRTVTSIDFDIPILVMKKLSALEQRVAELKREAEILAVGKQGFELDVNSRESIIELFMSEDGRAKLNAYFKINKFTFHAELDKAAATGKLEIKQGLAEGASVIALAKVRFPKKKILQGFGLPDLQEMFDLSIP